MNRRRPATPLIPELEREIFNAANHQSSDRGSEPAPRWRARRNPAAAVGLLVTVGAVLVAVFAFQTSDERKQASAPIAVKEAGAIQILTTPTVAVQRIAAPVRSNPRLRAAGLQNARSFSLPGGLGYLFAGSTEWCLTQPDPEAHDPNAEYGLGCVSTATAKRRGISQAMVGKRRIYYVAVIPDDVRPPVAVGTDGKRRELAAAAGVVRAEFEDRVTLYEYDASGHGTEHVLIPAAEIAGGSAKAAKAAKAASP